MVLLSFAHDNDAYRLTLHYSKKEQSSWVHRYVTAQRKC